MHAAVVFPHANRRAGVERVVWDLCDHLATHHQTTFVGLAMEESEGNRAHFLPVRPGKAATGPLVFRRSAQQVLVELRPDIVLSLGVECPPGDVYWVQSVHRAYLHRSQGPTVRGWQSPAWTRLVLPRHRVILGAERRYFTSARPRTILCTSPQEIVDLNAYYGVDTNRCRVMPNGYDPAIFNTDRRPVERAATRKRLGLGPQDVSLLFVANELHRKGFATLINALATIDLPQARIDVVGRVSSADYGSLIQKLGLEDRIRWHGSTREVFPFYAAADVLVLPTQYEPFGIVIVEALASGLPVITSRLAGASPAVEQGGCGRLLSDPTDVGELAGYLMEAGDPTIRELWGAKAAAGAQPYRWPKIFADVEEVLTRAYHSQTSAT